MKKTILALCIILSPLLAGAQDAAPAAKTFWDDPVNHPMFGLYLITFLVFIALVLTVIASVIVLRVLNLFVEKAARERAERLGIAFVQPQSWWSKLWHSANALVPLEEEKNIELDHDYDGIRELDNHLPPWWKGLFYGSIVFAVIYLAAYHISNSLPLSEEEYLNEVAKAEAQARENRAGRPAEVIDENTLAYSADAEKITHGKAVFVSNNCASCHRNDGGGNTIGPNLTDTYWLHGGDIKSVFHTINVGVVEKAMPAWGKVMSRKDVRDLAFYVMSLQGTNPPNSKSPQGTLFKPVVKQDSASVDTTHVRVGKK